MIFQSSINELGEFMNSRAKQPKEGLDIAVLKPRKGEDNPNPEYYTKKIINVIEKNCPDIIIAPYHAFEFQKPFSEDEKLNYLETIIEETKNSDSLIIPGTFFWHNSKKALGSNPIIYQNEILEYIRQRYDPESLGKIERTGFEIERGNQKGIFNWKGWKIGFENCKDHGALEKENEKVDIQLVLASDLGGLVVSSLVDSSIVAKDKGYVLYCDYVQNFPEVENLIQLKNGKYIFKKPNSTNKDFSLYTIRRLK